MDFIWDEDKRRKNLAKHGLDFADVALLDWATAKVLEDTRIDYGEQRYWAFAMWNARLYLVAFAARAERRFEDMAHRRTQKNKTQKNSYGTPDSDVPEMTAADFRKARPAKDVLPGLITAAKRARGRPPSANPKQHVSLRLDAKVIAGFKAQGPGWQGRINDALTQALTRTTKQKTGRTSRTG